MSATARLVRKRGRDATVETFSVASTDSQGDPTWQVATSTSTSALVRFPRGGNPVVRTSSGEERQVDAVVTVPKDDAPDPTDEDRPPEIVVEGKRYVIHFLDPHVLGDIRRLMCTLSRA